jgi:hypothetical protein
VAMAGGLTPRSTGQKWARLTRIGEPSVVACTGGARADVRASEQQPPRGRRPVAAVAWPAKLDVLYLE